jgi:hypothetical protein
MSFTRFHDDPARIKKSLEESTYAGRYAINMPGPGDQLPFINDPQIILQQWGSNLMTNTVNVESDLRGMTRKLNRDLVDSNDYRKNAASTKSVAYPQYGGTIINESRATHPSWIYRNVETVRWETPLLDPQAHTEKEFHTNIQTRILEKDYFVPKISHFPNL